MVVVGRFEIFPGNRAPPGGRANQLHSSTQRRGGAKHNPLPPIVRLVPPRIDGETNDLNTTTKVVVFRRVRFT